MKRFLSVLLRAAMMLTLASAAFAADLGLSVAPASKPASAVINFDDLAKRTVAEDLKQVWTDNGITVTIDFTPTSSGSQKLTNSCNPYQFLKGSAIKIEYPGMTYIRFQCQSATMAKNYVNSLTAQGVTAVQEESNANSVVITLPEAADSFVFNLTTGNGYAWSITVYTTPEFPAYDPDLDIAEFVIELINKIGTVTLESRAAIDGARAFYNKLTDAQKALVTNYETLTKAETDLKALMGDAPAADPAILNFTSIENRLLMIGSKSMVAWSQNGVSAVITDASRTMGAVDNGYLMLKKDFALRIASAGMTALEIECQVPTTGRPGAKTNADKMGEALTAVLPDATVTVEAEMVYVQLTAPMDFIDVPITVAINLMSITVKTDPIVPPGPSEDELAAQAVTEQIEALGTVTLQSESAIKAARGAYDALTDAQKALVTNYETLTAAEGRLQELKKEAETPVVPAGDNAIMFFALAALSMTAMAVLVAKKREF